MTKPPKSAKVAPLLVSEPEVDLQTIDESTQPTQPQVGKRLLLDRAHQGMCARCLGELTPHIGGAQAKATPMTVANARQAVLPVLICPAKSWYVIAADL